MCKLGLLINLQLKSIRPFICRENNVEHRHLIFYFSSFTDVAIKRKTYADVNVAQLRIE